MNPSSTTEGRKDSRGAKSNKCQLFIKVPLLTKQMLSNIWHPALPGIKPENSK